MCTSRRAVAFVVVALAAGSVVLAACGSGGAGNDGGVAAAAPMQLCGELNAVLSDGPDPTADPVGYALSQILPLKTQVHGSDAAVMHTVHQLVAADQALYESDGTDKTAASTIATDYTAINKSCPGVAP